MQVVVKLLDSIARDCQDILNETSKLGRAVVAERLLSGVEDRYKESCDSPMHASVVQFIGHILSTVQYVSTSSGAAGESTEEDSNLCDFLQDVTEQATVMKTAFCKLTELRQAPRFSVPHSAYVSKNDRCFS